MKLTGLADEIWKKKYKFETDKTIEDTWKRVAESISSIEGNGSSIYKDEFYRLLEGFNFLPGGRITAGAGTKNNYLLNCGVIPIEDKISGEGSIFRQVEVAAYMAKCNYGVGINFSTLRPKGTSISVGGFASGVISFMKNFDTACSVIQDGGGRRAALIGILNVNHPEIFDFIDAKRQEGVLTQFNISVGISNYFIDCVKNDLLFNLEWNGRIYKTVKAREIWDKLVYSGYHFNDPGIINLDEVNFYNNGFYLYDIEASNPCIIGSTLIATADGRNAVPIEQLAQENKDIPIYSTNLKTGQIEIKWGRNPRKTGAKSEVWKLTLDNNTSLIATPNHKILLKDSLTYVELKNLKEGDSIMPFYSSVNNGYRQISFSGKFKRSRRQYRLINEFFNGKIDAKKIAVHHKDRNKLNDSIYNLELMTHNEHIELHTIDMLGPKNPYHKMSIDWKFKFASHPGETNSKYSGLTNNELIEHGKIVFDKYGKFTKRLWVEYAKENGLPQCISNDFRFGSFENFNNQVCENHKVVSVEFYGYEDVFNITVDDNHNYCIITETEDANFTVSSGICIKNCGEIPLPPWGVCDLGNLNLTKYIKKPFSDLSFNDNFDEEKFVNDIRIAVRFLDNVLDVSDYPYPELKERAQGDRRIGLNFVAGLGSALAMLKIPYASEEGRNIAGYMQRLGTRTAYFTSANLAIEKGVFPNYDKDKFWQGNFVNKPELFSDEEIKSMKTSGLRNIALTTIPPVGTGSLLAKNISNGGEPIFALEYFRNVRQLDGTTIQEPVEDYAWSLWKEMFPMDYVSCKDLEDTIAFAPDFFKTSREISPKDHILMQSELQKWIDGSISKTINMAENTTIEDYEKYLLLSIDLGCKGFTSFRDGTREGVLVEKKDSAKLVTENSSESTEKIPLKRSRVLDGKTYQIQEEGGHRTYCTINYLENNGIKTPWEIFLFSSSRNHEWYASIGRLASRIMRKTGDVQAVIDELKEIGGENGYLTQEYGYVQSKPQHIGFILEEFVNQLNPKLKKQNQFQACPECKEVSYLKEGGCGKCTSCGYSTCS